MKIKKKTLYILITVGVLLGTGTILGLNGFFGGGGNIPSDTFTRGLVGYWSMDEGSGQYAYDGSGNSNTGILGGYAGATSSDPKWTTGKVGGALQFDGKDDYVEVADDTSFDVTNDLTVSAWFNENALSVDDIIVGKYATAKREWALRKSSAASDELDELEVSFGDSNGDFSGRWQTSNANLVAGRWYHVVFTFSSGVAKIYVDGVEKTGSEVDGSVPSTLNNEDAPVRIGTGGSGQAFPFNGLIDEVRIYNRALSAEEIRYHYNRGGPIAHWTFDEGNGKVAFDGSGNNNSGHLHGPALNLNGTNQYASTTDSATLKPTDAMTIEAWVNPTQIKDCRIIAKENSTQTLGWMVYTDSSNHFRVLINGATGDPFVTTDDVIPINTWTHLLATYDTTNGLKLYMNGILKKSAAAQGSIQTATDNLLIGRSVAQALYFPGVIDEVRFYSRTLSATEVLEHYQGKYTDNSGMVGYWAFDENTGTTASDSSGNGNNLTLINTPTWVNYAPTWTTGKNGNALSFDGTDDYVSVSNSSSIDITAAVTISTWIKSSVFPATDQHAGILMKGNAPAYDINYQMRFNNAGGRTRPELQFLYSAGEFDEDVTEFQTGAWYHLVITFDEATDNIKFYVNSKNTKTITSTGTLITKAYNLYIGSDYDSGVDRFFNGLIDDVRIYNYARTADEIALDYNAGFAAHFGPQSSCDDDPGACMEQGLVGYWNFEESGGQTAYDGSNYNNHGTLGTTTASGSDDPKWATGIKPLSGGASGGSALSFDGKNDYVNIPDSASLATNYISISAWFKINVWQGFTPIFNRRTSGNIGGFSLETSGTTTNMFLWAYINGSWSSIETSGWTIGSWHHIVATYDGSNLRMYRNGTETGTSTAVSGVINNSTSSLVQIGHNIASGDNLFFNGLIDEVRLYDRVLSAEEIRYHYNQSGPVAHWTFDEGSGQTAFDSSLNNNDGRLGSTTAADAGDPTWTTGRYGNALSFDGVNDIINAGVNTTLNLTKTWTIESWVYAENAASAPRIIAKTNNLGYRFQSATNIRAYLTVSSTLYRFDWTVSDVTNKWVHIVTTWVSGTPIKAYHNGVEVSVSNVNNYTTGDNDDHASTPLYIGSLSGTSEYLQGLIDDVRIYNYARTQKQIWEDYNGGLAAHFGPTENSSPTACDADPGACMEKGLVGYWNMEEGGGTTAYDRSDYSNNGTLTNGPRWTTGIKPLSSGATGGSALQFDGKDDYVNVGNVPNLNLTEAVTVEAWVSIANLEPAIGGTVIAGKWSTGWVNSPFHLSYQWHPPGPYRRFVFYVSDGTTYVGAYTGNIVANTWYHVVGTYNREYVRFYLNGALVSENAGTFAMQSTSLNFQIGSNSSGNSLFSDGSIDDVRIYNRALSAAEIRYHYNRGGPVAHWKFDEGISQTAFDESLNNNDGRLGSTTAADAGDPTWVEGKYGSALSFDGSDDYVDLGTSETLSPGISNFSVGMWVNFRDITATRALWVFRYKKDGSYVGSYAGCWRTGGVIGSYFSDYSPDNSAAVGTSITVGWHHIVSVFDRNDNIKLYLDGVKHSGGSLSFMSSNNFTHYDKRWIGLHPSVIWPLNGLIDDVRIYNYARTQEQILQDYNAGLSAHFK